MNKLEYEQRIIDFFGLKMIKVENTNLYLIKDSSDNLVGSLYLTTVDEETFCEIMINSENIAFYKKRNLNFVPSNTEYDYYDSDYYRFIIKVGNEKYDVNMKFNPLDISISNENGEFICLVINPNKTLYFSSNKKGIGYQSEEIVSVDLMNDNYTYILNCCKRLTGEKESIFLSCEKDEKCKDNELCLAWDLSLIDRPYSFMSERCYVTSSLLDVIKEHELAILAFQNLIQRLEQIIPGLSEVIKNNITEDSKLGVFMNELVATKRKDLKL